MCGAGYQGGVSYLASGELLSAGGDRFVELPKNMMTARTGFGLAYGPDRCIYAVGGSALQDGSVVGVLSG